jgi:glycosyltransferase involved in cell wall biosynthesis
MAMKVPVVSSKLGGVPELVFDGETGYMVEPGDRHELASAIRRIWTNQENYQKMQVNTRRLVQCNFNKARQFDQFKDHFYELVKSTS